VPPRTKNKGRVANSCNQAMSGTQNAGKPSANGGGKGGSRGLRPLARGVGDVPPQNQKRGRVAHLSNPATSGTQNAGKPSAHEGGQMGGPGGEAPMAGGLGDVPPQNQKRGRVARISNPATSGAQNPGKSSAHGGGQMGGPGGTSPLVGGMGGVPFTPTKVSLFEKRSAFADHN